MTARAVAETLSVNNGSSTSVDAAARAKHRQSDISSARHTVEFRQLPAYVERLRVADPDGDFHLHMDDEDISGVFICPSAMKHAFAAMPPFLAVDGAFSKTVYDYVLLLAASYDADRHLVVIAWGFALAETTATWARFLSHLKSSLPTIDNPAFVIVSDRQKGLLNAIDSQLPQAYEGYCANHLRENIRRRFNNAAASAFNALLYAPTAERYAVALAVLSSTQPRAAEYINAIAHDHWATYAFKGARYGSTTSNAVEQCNQWLKPLRQRPMVQLLQGIWDHMSERFVKRLDDARANTHDFVPRTREHLNKLRENAKYHTSVLFKDDGSQTLARTRPLSATLDTDQQRVVELDWLNSRAACSCNEPHQLGLPCRHVAAVVRHLMQDHRNRSVRP